MNKLVKVRWVDIVNENGWLYTGLDDDIIDRAPMTVENVGHLIRDVPQFITLAAGYSIDEDGDVAYLGLTKIPRGCIIKIMDLTVVGETV